jgi:hypothetical protein
MSTAFRELLVLQLDAGDARGDVLLDGADEVDGVSEPRVSIRDERHRDRLLNRPCVREHLGHRDQSHIRMARP